MAEIVYIQPDGAEQVVEAEAGTNVMRAALGAAVPGIVGECGGQLMCATCHCFVEGPLGAGAEISDDEDAMLDCTAVDREADSRLTCQLVAGRDFEALTVRVPETQV